MKVIMISKYFMPFLFNIINYSPKIINIQRREAELNIKLPRVNNFKQKKGSILNRKRDGIFVLLYGTTPNEISEDKG